LLKKLPENFSKSTKYVDKSCLCIGSFLLQALHKKRTLLKRFLLDQGSIACLGNIYVKKLKNIISAFFNE